MDCKRSEAHSYCTRLSGVGNQYRQLGPPIRITAQIFVPQIRAHDPLFIWAHLAMGRPTLGNLLPYFATASCVLWGRTFLVGARLTGRGLSQMATVKGGRGGRPRGPVPLGSHVHSGTHCRYPYSTVTKLGGFTTGQGPGHLGLGYSSHCFHSACL